MGDSGKEEKAGKQRIERVLLTNTNGNGQRRGAKESEESKVGDRRRVRRGSKGIRAYEYTKEASHQTELPNYSSGGGGCCPRFG